MTKLPRRHFRVGKRPFISAQEMKSARILLGWSREEAAQRASCTPTTIARIEKGGGTDFMRVCLMKVYTTAGIDFSNKVARVAVKRRGRPWFATDQQVARYHEQRLAAKALHWLRSFTVDPKPRKDHSMKVSALHQLRRGRRFGDLEKEFGVGRESLRRWTEKIAAWERLVLLFPEQHHSASPDELYWGRMATVGQTYASIANKPDTIFVLAIFSTSRFPNRPRFYDILDRHFSLPVAENGLPADDREWS